MDKPPLLSLRGVSKIFTETGSRIELFRDLDFDLAPGDFVSITGASGVGKSTLLHILGLLERPTAGSVLFRGEDAAGFADARLSVIRNRAIGFVFQFHHLLPDLTMLENTLLPLRIGGSPDVPGRARAAELLRQMGIADRAGHFPAQLSGGERQRAAVARALMRAPGVLLCDEPSGNLDAENSNQLHAMLETLNRELNVAVLVVTHDASLARRAARPLMLRGGGLRPAPSEAP